jgi:predicted choloylglycine hydrolase
MKKLPGVPATLFLIILCFTGHLICQNSRLTHTGNLRILVLEGEPYQRGFDHGKILKKEIQELLKLWRADIERSYKVNADTFIEKFLNKTNFQKAIMRWTPDLWEELKGIAEGAEVELNTMYAFQLIDEMWVIGRDVQANNCTTIGVLKTKKPSIVAQNLDIPRFYHGFQTLLHLKNPKTDWEAFVFTIPGLIAANGLNNHSIAVVVNAIQRLEHSHDGLPVAFVIRGILQRKTYDNAVKFIHTIKHGAPQNYMIGGRDNVGSFECSTSQVSPFVPFKGANFTYHTNHPLTNYAYTERFLKYIKSKNTTPQNYVHECPRFNSLQAILKDNSVKIDIDMLKKIFSNRKTIINNRGTYGCTIMVLKDNPELHISPGRPDEEPFLIFKFDRN